MPEFSPDNDPEEVAEVSAAIYASIARRLLSTMPKKFAVGIVACFDPETGELSVQTKGLNKLSASSYHDLTLGLSHALIDKHNTPKKKKKKK